MSLHRNQLFAGGDYKIKRHIASGSYGHVYSAIDYTEQAHGNKPKECVIKVEAINSPNAVLTQEIKLLKHLNRMRVPCIPIVLDSGQSLSLNYMCMQTLGPTVRNLIQFCEGLLSVKSALMITLQMVDVIKKMHTALVTHQDIKPSNMAIGVGRNSNTLFLIDFGLAAYYANRKTGVHVEMGRNECLKGTPRYASINSHNLLTLSRRDDIESLAYMLIHICMEGMGLPWSCLTDLDQITKMKSEVKESEICQGLPDQLMVFLKHSKQLDFDQVPRYEFLYFLIDQAA